MSTPVTLEALPCEDEVLVIRPVTREDEEDLFGIYGHAEVMRFASDPVFRDINDVRETILSIQRNLETAVAVELGIVLKATGKLVGICGFHNFDRNTAEIGYLLNRAYWGRGLMRRALKNFIALYSAGLDLSSISASVEPANCRSIRTLESLGFTLSRNAGAEQIYMLALK